METVESKSYIWLVVRYTKDSAGGEGMPYVAYQNQDEAEAAVETLSRVLNPKGVYFYSTKLTVYGD